MTIYRSRAPFRVSFAGGGTDIPSWANLYGGQVISTTINKYVYVTVVFNKTSFIKIKAYDLNKSLKLNFNDLEYNGEFDLIKAVIKHFNVEEGCEINIHSDLPPGSGMGTSSSLLVALISVIALYKEVQMDKKKIAELACKIEREELNLAGGYQDQFAAAFGGFNFITFGKETKVNELNLSDNILKELNYRLLLCYTGKTHISSDIQKILIKNFEKLDSKEGLFKLKKLAVEMRDILNKNDISNLDTFGEIQHQAWIAKKRTSDKISDENIEKLYLYALQNGAIGGKLLGAGGGGHLLLFIDPMKRIELINKLQEFGIKIIDFQFEDTGVTCWKVK